MYENWPAINPEDPEIIEMKELMLKEANARIPTAIVSDGFHRDELVYLFFGDEKEILPLVSDDKWPGEAERIMLKIAQPRYVIMQMAASLWPTAHLYFTPCSCCISTYNFREYYANYKHVPPRTAC